VSEFAIGEIAICGAVTLIAITGLITDTIDGWVKAKYRQNDKRAERGER
jgi:hypothetical protein